jgi:hypothetical protein
MRRLLMRRPLMRRVLVTGLLVLVVVVLPAVRQQASAARITPIWLALPGPRPAVLISGPILLQDAALFSAEVDALRRRYGRAPAVALDTPGGNVLASRAVATLVEYGRLDTVLGDGATCASACALIFFSGAHKIIGPDAHIGVHRAATPTGIETASTLDTSWSLAKALRNMGARQGVIDKLMTTSPGRIAWLNPSDLAGLSGVTIAAVVLEP